MIEMIFGLIFLGGYLPRMGSMYLLCCENILLEC